MHVIPSTSGSAATPGPLRIISWSAVTVAKPGTGSRSRPAAAVGVGDAAGAAEGMEVGDNEEGGDEGEAAGTLAVVASGELKSAGAAQPTKKAARRMAIRHPIVMPG